MDLSQLATLLQDLGDNAELADRIKTIINEHEATDLLQHFRLDAVIKGECTTHVEYRVEQDLIPRKAEKRWYRMKEPIGRGTYGRVWLERDEKQASHRAVKIMAKDLMTRDGIDYKKEILALAKFSKPQYQQQQVLVQFLGWLEDPSDLFLYMEYFKLGDLEGHITESITEDDVKDITTNLLNGLRIMHHEGFAHRDLKPGNIFVVQKPPTASWWVKIGDFGISKRVNHELTALYTSIGTRLYMAPEVTGDLDTDEPTSKYDNAVDIWSLGCVVYKVATQGVPFRAPRDLRRFCAGGSFPEQPLLERIAADGVAFVKSLLVANPQNRLSAESALKVPWLLQRERNATQVTRPPDEHSIQPQTQGSVALKRPETKPTVKNNVNPAEATVRYSPPRVPSNPEKPGTVPVVDFGTAAIEPTIRISAPEPRRPAEPSQRRLQPRSPQPDSKLHTVQTAVTHVLQATKQLLNKLTEWSKKEASDVDVSDAYVRLGYEFNITCRAFLNLGIDTTDLGPVPDNLRTVLEDTLGQDPSAEALDRYLPRIRDIIISLLHGLKKKQALLAKASQTDIPGSDRSEQTGRGRKDPAAVEMTIRPSSPDSKSSVRNTVVFNRGSSEAYSATKSSEYLKRPDDDRVVHQLFLELMDRRGWKDLPEQAQRQMLSYPATKKWTLIHQDRLSELQDKREGPIYHGYGGPTQEGSPEWYIKKILDDSITAKDLNSLAVSLQTQIISWVKVFVDTRGLLALASVLTTINSKKGSKSIAAQKIDGMDMDSESLIVKCFKAAMNTKYGANDALAHQQILVSLVNSLVSPSINTRKVVTGILTFLCDWNDNQGHQKVLKAMDHVKDQHGEVGRFDLWIRAVEIAIDGRGRQIPGAGGPEGISKENHLLEYSVSTAIFINMLVDTANDLTARWQIRAQFISCGIKRVMVKLEGFQYDGIDKQIEHFRENEMLDYEELLEREEKQEKLPPTSRG
ncbi:armadillo-type protein [Aspergillus granulosus]|uniref:Armadillo-type protein n=1 Tax=Aspergillus granulosus TaxID=176169 RepID=A0ABR4H1C3_9EURO